MQELKLTSSILKYNSIEELSDIEQNLLKIAYKHAKTAYAPFSNFHVGTAILLANNEIIGGSNQENASYPAGICAERVALSAASSIWPTIKPVTIAIVVNDATYQADVACAPCGICRQTINETENRYNQPIEIIFPGENGTFYKVETIKSLLPLSFNANNLI